jgi:hypothetical protein
VEKNSTARQVTDDNIIQCMHFVRWITKAADTQNMYYLLLFHSNSGYMDAPQYYDYMYISCLVSDSHTVGNIK